MTLAAWSSVLRDGALILGIVVDPSSGLRGWQPWRAWFAACHLISLALLAAVVVAWARHRDRRLLVASGCITAAAITLLYIATVGASDIPIDWITVLQHGLGGKTIMHLYTLGTHAGGNFAFVLSATAAGQGPNLHTVVWLNLLLGLVNAAIFFHLALYVTGRWWALPWALAFALNPAMFLASFSELPTNLLALYFLIGAIAWAVLYDPQGQPVAIRAAAWALCALLTLLVALTRVEVAFIGVVALTVHTVHALLGPERWSAAWRRLGEVAVQLLVLLDARPAAIVGLCVLGAWFAKAGLPWGLVGRQEMAGVYPFNASILSLYVYLPMLLLPIGVSLAIFFGSIHAIVHFRQFGGLALSLFLLVRAYFAAESGYYEMGRYISYVLPAVFLLGLFGKATLDEMVCRRLRPGWCAAARVAYLMAWFTLPLPGIPELYARPEYHGADFSQLLLDLNTQREARHLLALTEQNPQCVFVSRVVHVEGNFKEAPQYEYIVFGGPIGGAIVVPEKQARLEEVIAQYASGVSCVRLYYGGDCNLTFTDRCKSFIAGHRLLDEYRFWSRPYTDPLQSGYGAPEIVLATYAWP